MAATTRLVDANGLTFTVEEAGAGDAVAILLHGFPENRSSWRHQMQPIADLGWRVVAPDMRGYGDSSRPLALADYRINHLVDDVAALFDACGAKRRLLIGHDWGAAVAWAFAIGKAQPLEGLVVMNVPHPSVFRDVLRGSWAQRRRSWYIAFFQLPRVPEAALTARGAAIIGRMFSDMAVDKTAFPRSVLQGYRTAALKPGAMTAMLNYYRANLRSLPPAGAVPMVETPTLMIWGEEDVALGIELTEGYRPFVADFTLRRLPGVSHWVQQEAPGRVNAALADWLHAKGLAVARSAGAKDSPEGGGDPTHEGGTR